MSVETTQRRPPASRGEQLQTLAWVLTLTTLTVVGVMLLNHFVHRQFVTDSAPRHSLRLLTWNVGKIYLPWESRASNRDLRHIARVLRELHPHVVALQELRDREQLGRLLAELGRGWRGAIPADSYDRRAALLLRIHGRFFELPTTSGRIAQGAQLRLPDGRRVNVVSLHLDAFSAPRRLEQAQEISEGLGRRKADVDLLLGDFNLDPEAVKTRSADQQLQQWLTTNYVDAGKEAGTTTIFSRRLDYVFYRGKSVASSKARALRGQRINTMDHDPLLVDLAFSAP